MLCSGQGEAGVRHAAAPAPPGEAPGGRQGGQRQDQRAEAAAEVARPHHQDRVAHHGGGQQRGHHRHGPGRRADLALQHLPVR